MSAPDNRTIVLVAPNVSMRMGGEALKALSLLRQLVEEGYRVVQVVHERCRVELERDFPEYDIRFAPEGRLQRLLYRKFGGGWTVGALDAGTLARAARRVARERTVAIVHCTAPISPVFPHLPIPKVPTVIGPINGNILYPPGFQEREERDMRLRLVKRHALPLAQWLVSRLARGKHRADAILIAGGERTRRALRYAGIGGDKLIDTLDSGVAKALGDRPAVDHQGRNPRFVHVGRLTSWKACDLVIRAVAQAKADDLILDIIGGGEEEGNLRALVGELGLEAQVNLVGWLPNGVELFERLRGYRGFVFPSLSEANGIALQEAMMLGLPIVALDWGGAADLLDADSAILIDPRSPEHVVNEMAAAMDRLAGDADLANRLARRARGRADAAGFVWPQLARSWVAIYNLVLAKRGQPLLRT